jgi:hypothetical protein
MIQLATDPNASRAHWGPTAAEVKDKNLAARRLRNGHAWPFIARHGERPNGPQQDGKRTTGSESGS